MSPFADPLPEAIEAARQIRGILQSAVDRAAREERSLVGLTARFVGFPSRVRRHLADRGFSSAVQTAGFAASVAGKLLIGVLASLLAAALFKLIG